MGFWVWGIEGLGFFGAGIIGFIGFSSVQCGCVGRCGAIFLHQQRVPVLDGFHRLAHVRHLSSSNSDRQKAAASVQAGWRRPRCFESLPRTAVPEGPYTLLILWNSVPKNGFGYLIP